MNVSSDIRSSTPSVVLSLKRLAQLLGAGTRQEPSQVAFAIPAPEAPAPEAPPPEAPPPEAAAIPPPAEVGGPCSRPQCQRRGGWRCGYRDAAGVRCGWWCQDHVVFDRGRAWCYRHLNTMRAVPVRTQSIYDVKTPPAMGDRSPNLVNMLVDQLDEPVLATLRNFYGRLPGVEIKTDPLVREGREMITSISAGPESATLLPKGTARYWHRGWGVFVSQGYVCRIALKVRDAEPPVVQAVVNQRVMIEAVPTWITNRAQGQPTPSDAHQAFNLQILAAILKGLPDPPEEDEELL